MDMQSSIFLARLADLVRSGEVPTDRLDDAVRRVLRVKFALGLFDRPYVAEPAGLDGAEIARGTALARQAAEESFVLLENRPVNGAPLLPLKAGAGTRVALIGPLADSAGDMLGSWTAVAKAHDAVSLRSALAERAARAGIDLEFAGGTDAAGTTEDGFSRAVRLARRSDLVILALGETGRSSGEASARSRLEFPGNEEKLLERIVATGKPVVLVVFSGRPLALPWAAAHVPAVLEAWFPGLQAGPALEHVLFGDADLPRTTGEVPIYYDHLNTGRPRVDPEVPGTNATNSYYVTGYIDEKDGPLYPFGYGLTYTTFSYSPVRVDAPAISAGALNRGEAHLTVSADVRNTGGREGTETVQLYIRLRGTSVARPLRELKGFERVHLQAGESRTVEFTLGQKELSFWNIAMQDVAEPGSLFVWVAPDCTRGSPATVEIRE